MRYTLGEEEVFLTLDGNGRAVLFQHLKSAAETISEGLDKEGRQALRREGLVHESWMNEEGVCFLGFLCCAALLRCCARANIK